MSSKTTIRDYGKSLPNALRDSYFINGVSYALGVYLIGLSEMLVFTDPNIKSRNDADRYVSANRDKMLAQRDAAWKKCDDMDKHMSAYKEKLDYWSFEHKKKGRLKPSDRDELLAELEHGKELFYTCARDVLNKFCVKSDVCTKYYYTVDEVKGVLDEKFYNHKSIEIPVYLHERIYSSNGEYVNQYMPSPKYLARCNGQSKVKPDIVLKGISLGDYIGQPYEAFIDHKLFNIEKPYDENINAFTDDTVMALAIYDACKALTSYKNISPFVSTTDVNRGYYTAIAHMKYYASMTATVGYGPRFYQWAINGAPDYDSYANGGAMRSGVIGAYFRDIHDVILFAIISSFATHSHPIGERAAVVTAVCVWMAAHGASQDDIRDYVIEQNDATEYEDGMIKLDPMVLPDNMNLLNDRDPKATHTLVGMSTVVQAVVNFYNSNNTLECIANAMKYPCDADTVAAISGGIAAAYYGDVPFIDDILKSEIARNRSAENKFIIDHINMT